MSDGVELAVFVAYPTSAATGQRVTGSFPVILNMTPYATKGTDGNYFVQRGYIYVTARVRGTQTSGGTFGFFSKRDALDGKDLVAWAANQLQGSNGVVGMHGSSWGGLDQLHSAATLGANSPVKAMVATCAGAEFYRETYFNGGIPTQTENFLSNFGNSVGGTTAQAYGDAARADIQSGGSKAYYGDFWKQRSVVEEVQAIANSGIPALLWSSNGDIYAQSSLTLYAYLQNAYAGQPLYGPMNRHIAPTPRYQINISQGGHCQNEDLSVQLEWYETWLKGVNTGMDKTALPLHMNEIGTNRWASTSHYPVVRKYTKFYMGNAGTLSTHLPGASGQEKLNWAQPGTTSTVQYDSPVFSEGATLAGPISASIYASSTTSNLELIATLQTVAPDGTATNLTQGAVLGSMAKTDPTRSWVDREGTPVLPYGTFDMDRFVPPNTINKFDFVISPRFAHVAPGSKLRLVFTTQTQSNRCTGLLGVDPCFPTMPQQAGLSGSIVTLYHGPAQGSSLNLPLLPASCWVYGDNSSAPTPSIPQWGPTDPEVRNQSTPCQQEVLHPSSRDSQHKS
jgi:predicted acyl esterase